MVILSTYSPNSGSDNHDTCLVPLHYPFSTQYFILTLPTGQAPNSPSPPPIPMGEKYQQQNVPIPVPRKKRLATGKHTADISPKAKASPNGERSDIWAHLRNT